MLSIIIPNYNKFDLLQNCLKSILTQTDGGFEIVIVDNGSIDERPTFAYDSRLRLIWLDKNQGFSKAVNIGIKEARGEYIAILNNDTELAPDWLEKILKAFEQNPEAMFLTSRIMSYYQREIFDDVGNVVLTSGKAYKIGNGEKNTGQYDQPRYIFGASGAASVYRREFFEKVGYFDEDFFAYLEDVDLSFRANLLGFKCLYVPDAVVYHVGSATTGSRYNEFTVFYLAQNTINLIIKDFPKKLILKSIFQILLHLGSLKVFFFMKGFLTAFIKGVVSGIVMSKVMLEKRRDIMKNKILSDMDLEKLLRENKALYLKSKANRMK